MTDREKAIVMAHTGICMLTGDKFQIFHKYIEDIMGRPIMTHEIGLLADSIKEKSKADFLALCAEQEPTTENDIAVSSVPEKNSKKLEKDCESDCIIRDSAIKALDYDIEHFEFKLGVSKHMDDIAKLLNTIYEIQANNIKALPSVTPRPKTGYWIEHPHEAGQNWEYSRYECSECHVWSNDDSDYCPNCGTKMIEPQERNDRKC